MHLLGLIYIKVKESRIEQIIPESLESLQYNVAIASTEAIMGTSEKLFSRTRLEKPKLKTLVKKIVL